MTQFTDQQLSAYLDGELSETLTQQLEAEIVTNKTLADRLEALRNANREFISAHEGLVDEAIPQSLLDVLDRADDPETTEAQIVDFPTRLQRTRAWLMPLAACLVLAIGVGIGARSTPTPAAQPDRMIIAGKVDPESALYNALEALPSGATENGFSPKLTYKIVDGGYCREVETSELKSLACRDTVGQWNVLAIVENSHVGDQTSYRPASANAAKLLDQLADELMVEIPLSAADETALLKEWTENAE